jgi:hypothetical protein
MGDGLFNVFIIFYPLAVPGVTYAVLADLKRLLIKYQHIPRGSAVSGLQERNRTCCTIATIFGIGFVICRQQYLVSAL